MLQSKKLFAHVGDDVTSFKLKGKIRDFSRRLLQSLK